MAYSFYIDGVQLPIAPSKMNTKISNKNKTIILINDGEINFLKKPGLTEIDFEVTIPQVKYSFAVYTDGFKPASYFLGKFEQLKVNQSKFQFIVSRVSPDGKLLFDTNMKVSLEEYSISEDANEGFDLSVSVKLKQYRDFGTKTIVIKPPPTPAAVATPTPAVVTTPRPVSVPTPRTYTVVKGDTLWAICKKYLGDGAKYPSIASLNGISNPNLIYPGQVIRLE